MNLIFFICFIGLIGGSYEQHMQQMKCGIRTCLIELFNLNDITFRSLLKKAQTVSFCVKECSPPGLTEFLQSISFSFTKTIPGICTGDECVKKNRFISLSHCMNRNSWQLIHCGVRLVDLMQAKKDDMPIEERKNKTCDVLMESIRCVEDVIARCGPQVHSLLYGGIMDVVEVGANIYCKRSYIDGNVPVTIPPEELTTMTPFNDSYPTHKPVAKGYKIRRGGNGGSNSIAPASWLIASVVGLVSMFSILYR